MTETSNPRPQLVALLAGWVGERDAGALADLVLALLTGYTPDARRELPPDPREYETYLAWAARHPTITPMSRERFDGWWRDPTPPAPVESNPDWLDRAP